jgi:serine phosphatase RsbU (regulator of sigma subunit)
MILRDILKKISIFNHMNEEELELIIPLTRQLNFPENSIIIKEGSEGSSMYILLDGKVKITKSGNSDSEVDVAVLDTGSYFGELSLIDDMPRSANVIALEDCKMLHLRKKDFDELISNNLTISNKFYQNCLTETFSRFRKATSNFTFSQHILQETAETLKEINKDLSLAKEVQSCLIDLETLNQESVPGIQHSYIYEPCQEIGGDFVNLMKDGNNMAVLIADVVGHGITAAMATGVIKSALSIFSKESVSDPGEMMSRLNKHYFTIMQKYYATCYYAYFNTSNMTVSFSKGGHHQPLFWNDHTGDFIEVVTKGIGVGMMKNAEYQTSEYPIEKGDILLFYTDGILEQHNRKNEMFSFERLKMLLKNAILEDIPNKLEYIKKNFENFCDGMSVEDDITLFLIEIK